MSHTEYVKQTVQTATERATNPASVLAAQKAVKALLNADKYPSSICSYHRKALKLALQSLALSGQ